MPAPLLRDKCAGSHHGRLPSGGTKAVAVPQSIDGINYAHYPGLIVMDAGEVEDAYTIASLKRWPSMIRFLLRAQIALLSSQGGQTADEGLPIAGRVSLGGRD